MQKDTDRRASQEGPVRSDRPTLAVVATGIAVALSLFGDMAMYVILPAQHQSLGLSAMQVGLLLSVNRWIRVLTNQVAQRMLRRRNARPLFLAALGISVALCVGYALAPSFVVLLLLRMAWGACWSVIRHTGVMTTVGAAPAGRKAQSMGLYTGIVQIGFMVTTFAAGWLFDWGGFQRAFLLAAALTLSAIPAALAGATPRRERTPEAPRDTSRTDSTAPPDPEVRVDVTMMIRGFIVSFVSGGLIMSTLGFLLREEYGDAIQLGSVAIGVTALNGMLLSLRSVVGVVGAPVSGVVIDRLGLARSQFLGFAFSGAALLVVAALPSTWATVPLVVLFFVGATFSRLAIESRAATMGHKAYAALATSTDIGSAAGPVVGWLGIELARSELVFWVGGGMFVIAALLGRMRSSRTEPISGE